MHHYAELSDLHHVSLEWFPPETPTRLDVTTGHCTIPLLVVRRTSASRLVVVSNGAVDLERSRREPVFQRSTWWPDIEGHVIYVCDPGTVGPDALSLAWGQLTVDYWFAPDAAAAVQSLSEVLGVQEPSSRCYFGSSAGGFLSLAMAAYDPGSLAQVNNAQFDWTTWMVGSVNELRTRRFGNMLPTDIRANYPTRSSVLRLLAQKAHSGRVDYWVNVASQYDRVKALEQFQDFMKATAIPDLHLSLHTYEDHQLGHNPLRQSDAVRILNDFQ